MKISVMTAAFAAVLTVATVGGASAQTASPPAGAHTMDGKVTKVDAKRGWVDVKTAEGSMKLHFPPPALDSVKKGDSVTIELGMAAAPATHTNTMRKTK